MSQKELYHPDCKEVEGRMVRDCKVSPAAYIDRLSYLLGGGGGALGFKLCGQITRLAKEDELCYQQRDVVFVFLVRYFCQFGATVCTAKLYCKCIRNKPYS
jgi:hypothetical protein